MNIPQVLSAVDHAAAKDDRWLFLAAFILLLILCGAVIYWLVRQLQSAFADCKTAAAAHSSSLAAIIQTQNETAVKLAVCIDRNTEVLQECNFQLRRLQEIAVVVKLILFFIAPLALLGCSIPRPLKGGHAATTGAVAQSISQGDNPSQTSKQAQESLKVRTYTLPAGTRIEQSVPPGNSSSFSSSPSSSYSSDFGLRPSAFPSPINPSIHQSTTPSLPPSTQHSATPILQPSSAPPPPSAIILSAPMPVTEREEIRASTQLGAAQKDTTREIAAKLASLRPIVFVGIFLFIAGLASMFWPPLKAIVNSTTTSAAFLFAGLALVFLPSLVVTNERLIFCGVAISLLSWFIAHRYGRLQGFVDANKNGIDDRLEKALPPSQNLTPES